MRYRNTENANDSPTSSPTKMRLGAADQSLLGLASAQRARLGEDAPADLSYPGTSQKLQRATPRPLFGGDPGPAPPLPLQLPQRDGLPNQEESPEDIPSTPRDWQIPARPPAAGAQAHRPSVVGAGAGAGAAVKLSRREAWLKMLALDGAVQVCLDSMVQGEAEPAAAFLMEGCQELKQVLGLGQLLLPAAGVGSAAETSIYWDDREDGAGLGAQHAAYAPKADVLAGSPARRRQLISLSERMAEAKLKASPVRAAQQSHARLAPQESAGPFVEARVLRVVGCGHLAEAGTGPNRGRRFRVVMCAVNSAGEQASSSWAALLQPLQPLGLPGARRGLLLEARL